MAVDSPIVVLTSGAIGGAIATICVHPLDTLKTRLQSPHFGALYRQRSVLSALSSMSRREMFSGLGVLLTAAIPASGIYFCTYELAKRFLGRSFGIADLSSSAWLHLTAGAVAEASASMLVVPAEVLKIRQQVECTAAGVPTSRPSPAAWQIARRIVQAEGTRGLYRGWAATVSRDAPFSAIQFMIYEFAKAKLEHAARRAHRSGALTELSSFSVALAAGGAAGAVAAAVTNPLDVIKTRLQLVSDSRTATSYRQTVAGILHEEGIRGLTAGVVPRTVWMTLVTSLTFSFYEISRLWLGRMEEAPVRL